MGSGHLDALFTLGQSLADLTVAFLLGHLDLGIVDGAGGGFLAERGDIAGFIGDVLDVDVDQPQTDLLQFDFNAVVDVLDQLFPVGVDRFDRHRRDGYAHLAEDDVLGQIADFVQVQSQQPLGGIFHHAGLGRDADGEGRWRVDADVLLRERPFKLDLDRDRRQVKILVVLGDRHDKGAAAMIALGGEATAGDGRAAADLAINDQDAVGGTAFELHHVDHQRGEDHQRRCGT